jgi:hypothetical protein
VTLSNDPGIKAKVLCVSKGPSFKSSELSSHDCTYHCQRLSNKEGLLSVLNWEDMGRMAFLICCESRQTPL